MRRPRAVLFDDEALIRTMLKEFFLLRGYEVLSYGDAAQVCPLADGRGGACGKEHPCTDVMLTDFKMPAVNGVELLVRQRDAGCKLDMRNKAVMSGYIDDENMTILSRMGCTFFKKPFALPVLAGWLAACEDRTDLSSPLATRRREDRFESYSELTFQLGRSEQLMTGIAVNISRTGLCLKAPVRLRTTDTVRMDRGPLNPCSEASVRWVRPLGSEECLAGLQCFPVPTAAS